jgi:hypothetical protein
MADRTKCSAKISTKQNYESYESKNYSYRDRYFARRLQLRRLANTRCVGYHSRSRQFRAMKMRKRQLIAFSVLILIAGCAYLQTPQGSALLTTSESVANVALSAAATTYAGPVVGQLASAGLSALGSVLQSYVNRPIPPEIVKASPGVAGVGAAVAKDISPSKPVTQADVNAVYRAASIAAKK